MVQTSDILRMISDFGNSLLLLYALFIEGNYTIPFLIIIVVLLATKITADLLDY
ncbi:hypothetical protein HYU22_02780 [Candidatus Woesearchaeota archaeon]|nr:hypothetical protein [Candidatus Woesearchaeota archaeon]